MDSEENKKHGSIKGKDLPGAIMVMPLGLDAAIKKRVSGEFKSERSGSSMTFSQTSNNQTIQSQSFDSADSASQKVNFKQLDKQTSSSNSVSTKKIATVSGVQSQSSSLSQQFMSSASSLMASFQQEDYEQMMAETQQQIMTSNQHGQEIKNENLRTQIQSAITDLDNEIGPGYENQIKSPTPIKTDIFSPPPLERISVPPEHTVSKKDNFAVQFPNDYAIFLEKISVPPEHTVSKKDNFAVQFSNDYAIFLKEKEHQPNLSYHNFCLEKEHRENFCATSIEQPISNDYAEHRALHVQADSDSPIDRDPLDSIDVDSLDEHLDRQETQQMIAEESAQSAMLDKIMTPASQEYDSGSLKRRDPRKMFTDSSFYSAAHHPTVADQVEMAHRLSSALFNEDNMSSKGQQMYLNRAKRSGETIDDEVSAPRHDKVPNLKLVMNPEGKVQEWSDIAGEDLPNEQAIAAHANATVPSPDTNTGAGKGGELFAKRRKKAEDWVVDESTVGQDKPSNFADKFMQKQTFQQQQFQQSQQAEQEQQQQYQEYQEMAFRDQQEYQQQFLQQQFQQQSSSKQSQSLEIRRQQELLQQATMNQNEQLDLPSNFQHCTLTNRSNTPSFDTSCHNVQGINVWANTAPRGWASSGSTHRVAGQGTMQLNASAGPPMVAVCPATPLMNGGRNQQEEQQLMEKRMEIQRIEQIQMEQQKIEQMEIQRIEQQKIEQQRREQEQQRKERQEMETERLEQQRIEQQIIEIQRIEQQRKEQQQMEIQRLEQQKIEQRRMEQQRIEQQRKEQQQMEIQKMEQQKIEQQRMEQQRKEQQHMELQRLEQQNIEQQRMEQQQRLEQQRIEIQIMEQEHMEQQRLEQQRIVGEQQRAKVEQQKVMEQRQRYEQEQLAVQQQQQQQTSMQQSKSMKMSSQTPTFETSNTMMGASQEDLEPQKRREYEAWFKTQEKEAMEYSASVKYQEKGSEMKEMTTTTTQNHFQQQQHQQQQLVHTNHIQGDFQSLGMVENPSVQCRPIPLAEPLAKPPLPSTQQNLMSQKSSQSFVTKEVMRGKEYSRTADEAGYTSSLHPTPTGDNIRQGGEVLFTQTRSESADRRDIRDSGLFGGIAGDNNSLVDDTDYQRSSVKNLVGHFSKVKPKTNISAQILPQQHNIGTGAAPSLNYLSMEQNQQQSFKKQENYAMNTESTKTMSQQQSSMQQQQSSMQQQQSSMQQQQSSMQQEQSSMQQQQSSMQQQQSSSSVTSYQMASHQETREENSTSTVRRQSLKDLLLMDPATEHMNAGIIDPSAILRNSDATNGRSGSEGILKQSSIQGSSDNLTNKWDNHNAIARGWGGTKEKYHPVTFREIYNVDSQSPGTSYNL